MVAESARLAMFVNRLKAFVRIALCEVWEFPYELNIFVNANLETVLHVLNLIFHFVVFFMFFPLSGYANEYIELKDLDKPFCS